MKQSKDSHLYIYERSPLKINVENKTTNNVHINKTLKTTNCFESNKKQAKENKYSKADKKY